MKQHRILLLILGVLAAIPGFAQQRTFRASLPHAQTTGFYRVAITPEITAHCTMHLGNLRIKEERGKEVPYLHSADAMILGQDFREFSIIKSSRNANGNTEIVLRNSAGRSIEALVLKLRNTDAQRMASVSGSDDSQTFFSLRDSLVLEVNAQYGDTGVCAISLPLTSYPILRIEVFDRNFLPLEILGAGIYEKQQLVSRFIAVPPPTIMRKDSNDRRTYLWLQFEKPYRIDRLGIQAKAAVPFFRRPATLYVQNIPVARFTLDHTKAPTAWAELQTKQALLIIDNEDSPPLTEISIQAEQQRQFLLAYLEEGKKYALHFGDSSLPKPLYDLRHFRDSIRVHSLPELQPGPIEILEADQSTVKESAPLLGKRSMWVIILVVLAALIVATRGLMRQINRKG